MASTTHQTQSQSQNVVDTDINTEIDIRIPTPNSNLLLRTCQPRDAQAYKSLNANPANTAHEPHSVADGDQSIAYHEGQIAEWRRAAARGESNFMVVELQGRVIGMGGFNALFERDVAVPPAGAAGTKKEKVVDTGILIDSAYTRRGFGREALTATLDYAFGFGAEVAVACDVAVMQTQAANEPFLRLAMGMGLWDGDGGDKQVEGDGDGDRVTRSSGFAVLKKEGRSEEEEEGGGGGEWSFEIKREEWEQLRRQQRRGRK